jgi:hypothetical protein
MRREARRGDGAQGCLPDAVVVVVTGGGTAAAGLAVGAGAAAAGAAAAVLVEAVLDEDELDEEVLDEEVLVVTRVVETVGRLALVGVAVADPLAGDTSDESAVSWVSYPETDWPVAAYDAPSVVSWPSRTSRVAWSRSFAARRWATASLTGWSCATSDRS